MTLFILDLEQKVLNTGTAGQQIVLAINSMLVPGLSITKFMDLRSKLGFNLHLTCTKDPYAVIDYIASVMDKCEPSNVLSIYFISIFCFSMKYIPFSDRQKIVSDYGSLVIKHAVFNNDEHIQSILRFLQVGGAKTFPCPQELATAFLNMSSSENHYAGRLVSYLVDAHPKEISFLFWNWVSKREIDDPKAFVQLLADICSHGSLCIGPKDVMERASAMCLQLCGKNNPFSVIESSLTALRWFIKKRVVEPSFPIDFQQPSLVSIAICCYASYIEYGDIEKVPELPNIEDTSIQRAISQLILSASKNPNFRKLKVKSPIFDAIFNEFYAEEKTENNEYKNILSFGIYELTTLIELAHLLPAYLFVHAMRAVIKNIDTLRMIIKLVGRTPKPVLVSHIDDFYSFVVRTLKIAPSLADSLADCVRHLIIPLRPYLGQLMLHLHPIDFFNNQEVSAKFIIIETVLSLSRDVVYFLDDFEALWEVLSFVKLSPSYIVSVFNFFESIAPLVEMDEEFLGIGVCTLLPIYGVPLPQNASRENRNFYRSCISFCQVTSSDIIADPLFTAQSLFPFTDCALRLICSVKAQDNEMSMLLFGILDQLLSICPVEATAVAVRYIDLGFRKYKQEMMKFIAAMRSLLLRYNEPAFIMQARNFSKHVKKYIEFDVGSLLSSQIFGFTDNIRYTRLAIQIEFDLFTMLLGKPEHLVVLLEQWNYGTPVVFLKTIQQAAEKCADPEKIRYFREFIDAYGVIQPPLKEKENWNYRQFIEKYVQKPLTMPQDLSGTTEEMLETITKYYPLESGVDESIISFIKTHRYEKKMEGIIRKLIQQNIDKLMSTYYKKNWFIRLLYRMDIPFSFRVIDTPLARGICIRRKIITVDIDNLKEWEVPEVARVLQSKNSADFYTLISKYQSSTLRLMFWQLPSEPFAQTSLPSNAIHSLKTVSRKAYVETCDFQTIFRQNIENIFGLLNCTDWRNPPFFWTVLAFTITIIQSVPKEKGFFVLYLDALKLASKFCTAPIFEAADVISQMLSLANIDAIPEEFQTERFKGLVIKIQ